MVNCTARNILSCNLIFPVLFLTTVCFLPPATSHVTELSFNMPNIDKNEIDVYQDAYLTGEGIQLTTNEKSTSKNVVGVGRATYSKLLHLWDKTSGNLADFNTHFSFVINSYGNTNYGDGMAFLLTPNETIDSNITIGGSVGLPVFSDAPLTSINPFVAVEFDTYHNDWDPAVNISRAGTHVGINVNSMKSSNSTVWDTDVPGGIENEAWISYNSSSKVLSVIFTNYRNNVSSNSSLDFTVDLSVYLPEWVAVGFSASTGGSFEIHNIKSWQFNSSLQIDENNKQALLVGLTVGSSVLVGGLAMVGFLLWKKKNRAKEEEGGFDIDDSMENDFETGRGPRKFSYGELSRATDNFAEEQKLGEGGFGGVYRGLLKDLNSHIAVKRISKASKQGIKEYASEVKIISRLRHRNLVQLIGWCHEKRELLLVYEFMENGSLDFHLFKGKSLLTWSMRCKIAQGLASALLYLHEEWEQCILHRDIKSCNVMLDTNFNAKLGDFGLARLVDHEKGSQTTMLAGTMGYMAPECVITGKSSKESDVYSFGVVALELACGRKPIDLEAQESQRRMVEWVWDLYGSQKLLEAVDPKICADIDQLEMESLMIVGLWCVHPDHNLRPTIRQAIHVLNFEAPLPILPEKMPVPTYFAPPLNTPTSLVSSTYGSSTVIEISQIQSSIYITNTDSLEFTSSSPGSSPSLEFTSE